MEAPKVSVKHPPKQFAIPADIRALGNYGTQIVNAMRAEHQKRRSRKQ